MLKIQVIGHLGHDADIREFDSGKVARFSVAHTIKMQNGKERTTWMRCNLWDRANIHPYLKKGQHVYIEGFPTVDAYLKDGDLVGQLQISINTIQLLGSKKDPTEAQPVEDVPF